MQLYTKILLGLLLGILAGWLIHVLDARWITVYLDPVGQIFLRLIKLVVVPMILSSIILGASGMRDTRKLGSLGLWTILFFLSTTAIAIGIGVTLTEVTRPGLALAESDRNTLMQSYADAVTEKTSAANTQAGRSELQRILDLLVRIVPTNPIEAMSQGDMLGIIFFAVFFGLCLTLIDREKADTFRSVIDAFNDTILKMITLIMHTAPFGVFAIIADAVATLGIGILVPLGFYGLVVLAGLTLHLLITYGFFIFSLARQNPVLFLKKIRPALLLGFSTSSSSATLPVSMKVAQEELKVSPEVSSFVLPLGATINMDGTALYQGVAAMFIAQVFGIELTLIQKLLMVLTATLASIGAAGVPGAGMITLAVVLQSAGIPLAGIALIFGIDRLLDMFRTTINIVGDLTCTVIMDRRYKMGA
ncbi:MAG: dicarboxylate/amino acid:cation symporter [Spirochaetales bacterium]|nr:dicarboxylate/amino acid:cation symporter [Spirochaetales bacterium]